MMGRFRMGFPRLDFVLLCASLALAGCAEGTTKSDGGQGNNNTIAWQGGGGDIAGTVDQS